MTGDKPSHLVPLDQVKQRGKANGRDDYQRARDKAASATAPLTILKPETWQGLPLPETRWLVKHVIPAKAITTLGGHGETGKSLIAIQLGVARALGLDWLGFQTAPGRTLIVCCEDPEEQIHIRLASILKHYGAQFSDLGDRLRFIDRNDMLNALAEWPEGRFKPGEVTALYCQIMNLAIDTETDLVAFDSRYDVFAGEQNDTVIVHEFMTALRTMATEIDGAVLLLSHPSRSGLESGDGESGSVAWHNKVRSRLYLRQASRELDGNFDRVLEHAKSNWGPKFEPLGLVWDDGAFRSYNEPSGTVATIQNVTDEKAFLAGLDALKKQGRDVSDKPNSVNYVGRMMLGLSATNGLSKRRIEGAMRRLFDAGQLVVESYGAPSRGWKRIARCNSEGKS